MQGGTEEGGLAVFMTVSNLQRKPSLLSSGTNLLSDATGSLRSSSSEASSPPAHVRAVLLWTREDVEAWLTEAGMEKYLVSSHVHVPRRGALSPTQLSLPPHAHTEPLPRTRAGQWAGAGAASRGASEGDGRG